MDRLIEILTTIDGYAWGPVTIILLLGTGVFLAFRLGFPQIRRFFHAVGLISGRYDNPDDEGALTHFQALSATIGTGNIAGVAHCHCRRRIPRGRDTAGYPASCG